MTPGRAKKSPGSFRRLIGDLATRRKNRFSAEAAEQCRVLSRVKKSQVTPCPSSCNWLAHLEPREKIANHNPILLASGTSGDCAIFGNGSEPSGKVAIQESPLGLHYPSDVKKSHIANRILKCASLSRGKIAVTKSQLANHIIPNEEAAFPFCGKIVYVF